MKLFGIIFSVWVAQFLSIATAEEILKARPEADEIRWKDPARGAPVEVRIMSADKSQLVVEKTIGVGVTRRNVPLADLAGVRFTLTLAERRWHRRADESVLKPLQVLWKARSATLALSGSNAGETGLALATALRRSDTDESLKEAEAILQQIISKDWVQSRIKDAIAQQSHIALIRAVEKEKFDEADRLAWAITEDPRAADGMLYAVNYLGDRHQAALKVIDHENPRWSEDPEIMPERMRTYHLTVDFYLYPSLFHGDDELAASTGLRKAADFYQMNKQDDLVIQTLEDLVALYPESSAAKDSTVQLATLKAKAAAPPPVPATSTTESPKEEAAQSDEKIDKNTPLEMAGPPAPPPPFNIFGD